MSVHADQHQAVARALEQAEPGAQVHVFGPKERGGLLPNERRCVDPDAGQVVVYHSPVVELPGYAHACASCGESSGNEPPEIH